MKTLFILTLILMTFNSTFARTANLSCSAFKYVYNGVEVKNARISIYSTESGYDGESIGEEAVTTKYDLPFVKIKKVNARELVALIWVGEKKTILKFRRTDNGISWSTKNKKLQKELDLKAPALNCFFPLENN